MHGTIMSEEALNNFIYGGMSGKQDSHPISVFRVNGVVNQFEKFYSTYDIKDGNKMFPPPTRGLISGAKPLKNRYTSPLFKRSKNNESDCTGPLFFLYLAFNWLSLSFSFVRS